MTTRRTTGALKAKKPPHIMLDTKVVYVFARQDLPVAKQLVHTNHATLQMAVDHHDGWSGIPSIIVIGMPDEAALYRVLAKFSATKIMCPWRDPNYPELGLIAICTVPLSQQERAALACYRIYKPL